ncbi:hypothetical protein BDV95DRAFT_665713 [Massariosphaeria phaeospora]|uniref:USP domain-containing protein n=1 Tax=Massariosphaeria phaeospora TaxID=100035 RepID=A0A7C8MJV0_9PLEO|nr:hypothetical protein BDV95DRAFT_665713 [Massariosphaeria phaeospora]
MSQRDHGLMEPVVADDRANTVPASPPRRDSIEDADSSLTRKRPRLDSGIRATEAMSADTHASESTAPRDQVQMTIRSQPPSSAASADQEDTVAIILSTENAPDGQDDAAADSPPVLAIDEDDDDAEEGMLDYVDLGAGVMQVEYVAEDYFSRFPFTQHDNYFAALRSVVQHFQAANHLDGTVLPEITLWLRSLPGRPSTWRSFYLDRALWWDDFAALVHKVLHRRYNWINSSMFPDQHNNIHRYPFGENFYVDGKAEHEVFLDFLESYLVLCTRLLRVDIETLTNWTSDSVYDRPLISAKHIRHINTIFKQEKSPLFTLLGKDYGADTEKMGNRLLSEFIKADGVKHLLHFADVACGKVPQQCQNWIATWVTQILNSVGWSMLGADKEKENALDCHKYYRGVLQYVRRYNVDMQAPSKVVDTGVTKDLIMHFSSLLQDLCHWDDALASELAEEFLEFGDPDSPSSTTSEAKLPTNRTESFGQSSEFFAPLVMNAWRFKLLRKYVVKGRMELRVMSIGLMDTLLVEIWREYSSSETGVNHPVMQYLAEFLLHERVVDYIISVDSHPQIISRSGNIVGFLVVTHRYSERQTDAIWNTVSTSQDPRVVSATMTMLRGIVNLMEAPELLYLCTKLYDLPISSYTTDIFRFLRELSMKLQAKYVDWSATDRKARPWNVCIRVLQDTSPSRESNKTTNSLHSEACEQLRMLASYVFADERYEIYQECAKHIATRSSKATGSVRAVHILCLAGSFHDAPFFQRHLDVTRHILEEVCAFVKAEAQADYYPAQLLALQYRLEMFSHLLIRATEAIPVDLYHTLWDHLVGKDSHSNHFRDYAWAKFSEAVKLQSDNEVCKQLISTYVPKLESQYYTPGLFDFVANYSFPTTRRQVKMEDGDKELLQIRGADLLWSMMMDAPAGTIEDRAATLLASRYVELDLDHDVSLEEVEEAHVALVERCMRELLSIYQAIRQGSGGKPEPNDGMDMVASDGTQIRNEARFGRILHFVKMLLSHIRNKPEFNRSKRSDSKVEALETNPPFGNDIEVWYQNATDNELYKVFMGVDATFKELYTRICQNTGFTKINLFARGHRLSVVERGHEKINSMGLGRLLVQKAAGSEVIQPMTNSSLTGSVFERSVWEHFEELFACMDAADHLSSVLFDFLTFFPYLERISASVMSTSVSTDEIFPPGKVFQAKYAAQALQSKLREQLKKGSLEDRFLANAVQLLHKALLNEALISKAVSDRHEMDVVATLVNVLLEFLKERPGQEVSSSYFSNETAFVNRLMDLSCLAVKANDDATQVACQSYATILEASLHSREVWDAFIGHPDIPALHQVLLLTDPRKFLREQVAGSIASVCGGGLPVTSALTPAEPAAQFWAVISATLPATVRYPAQSEQLFEIAEQVFRNQDENGRDEDALRSNLTNWSDLLLHYKHEEFVGHEETDFVVMGFTKLLLCCISSLKSFKKPLNAGPLIERIFRKFLFTPRVFEINEELPQYTELPVLESKTRKELYDLVLALAEDRSSYGTLLDLVQGLSHEGVDITWCSYAVDRTNEIRSPTGYVGLYNPRAICYMNSLVTQLFMNVNFRKFMLGLSVADAGTSQRLLAETQKLFAQLQNSYRKAADPREFASCVKGLDSGPIDINIQMDADEFYNLLFDQWEGQMLTPESKQLFRSFYGGQTVNQIKSKECEHVSERVESFFVVQCDVQGKANLQESLQAFVEGDVMEGDNKYKCESCGGKFVDAVKRTCLKDVPDNLIFHLKRFDFDLVEMRRAKINDYFEFPTCIDVSPYNVAHLSDPSKPRQEDLFELVGVLVHSGNSENGHYYSYIRERPCPSGSMTSWFEFNDRDVDTFDHRCIPYHAFGGLSDDPVPRQQKHFSAYMLFYQRKAAIDNDHCQYISSPRSGAPKVPIPPPVENEIKADNEAFVREYSLYDPNHSRFIKQILATLRIVNHGGCSEDHQQEIWALRAVLDHLSKTLCRLQTVDMFEETMAQLRKTVLSCPVCCHFALKWLAQDEFALVSMLLKSGHAMVRAHARTFLIDSLSFLREQDPVLYGVESIDTDMDTGTMAPIEGILVDTTRRLYAVAKDSYMCPKGWDDLYLTLAQLSEMGHVETAIILDQGLLDFCLRVLCMHAYPQFRLGDPDIWRVVEKKKGIFNRMIEFLHTLFSKMDIRAQPIPNSNRSRLEKYDRSVSKFPLTYTEHQVLHFWHEETKAYAVLDRMIETFDSGKTVTFYPGEILKWMLSSMDTRTQHFLYLTVSEGIHGLNPPHSDPYVRAALAYCQESRQPDLVTQMVEAVVKSAHKLRDNGGKAHLEFFAGLLTSVNEVVFNQRHPDTFYTQLLQSSRKYAVALLIYEDDNVRKDACNFLVDLFMKHKADELANEECLRAKYRNIRALAVELMRKIAEEHHNGASRTYMQPMIAACTSLMQHLYALSNSEDPTLDQFKSDNDGIIFEQYTQDLEGRLRQWPQDDDTPISAGEAFEQSDYGSESDEGPDLIDMHIVRSHFQSTFFTTRALPQR